MESNWGLSTALEMTIANEQRWWDVPCSVDYELRDYRFYGKDMVHPNELAVDYIWEKFKSVWVDENEYPIMDKVDAVQKGLMHRPFNPDSEAHQKFKTSLRTKITYLQERYPFMKFS